MSVEARVPRIDPHYISNWISIQNILAPGEYGKKFVEDIQFFNEKTDDCMTVKIENSDENPCYEKKDCGVYKNSKNEKTCVNTKRIKEFNKEGTKIKGRNGNVFIILDSEKFFDDYYYTIFRDTTRNDIYVLFSMGTVYFRYDQDNFFFLYNKLKKLNLLENQKIIIGGHSMGCCLSVIFADYLLEKGLKDFFEKKCIVLGSGPNVCIPDTIKDQPNIQIFISSWEENNVVSLDNYYYLRGRGGVEENRENPIDTIYTILTTKKKNLTIEEKIAFLDIDVKNKEDIKVYTGSDEINIVFDFNRYLNYQWYDDAKEDRDNIILYEIYYPLLHSWDSYYKLIDCYNKNYNKPIKPPRPNRPTIQQQPADNSPKTNRTPGQTIPPPNPDQKSNTNNPINLPEQPPPYNNTSRTRKTNQQPQQPLNQQPQQPLNQQPQPSIDRIKNSFLGAYNRGLEIYDKTINGVKNKYFTRKAPVIDLGPNKNGNNFNSRFGGNTRKKHQRQKKQKRHKKKTMRKHNC